jgi:hypothetical protein
MMRACTASGSQTGAGTEVVAAPSLATSSARVEGMGGMAGTGPLRWRLMLVNIIHQRLRCNGVGKNYRNFFGHPALRLRGELGWLDAIKKPAR